MSEASAVNKFPSVCPMDCPDTCSLEVEVKEGQVTAIRGTDDNPITAHFICSKVANFTKRLYSPDRLLYPMLRNGIKGNGEFSRISWDEAIQLICQKFRAIQEEFGGEAILPYSYGGSNGLLGQDTSDKAFFAMLGASRLARTVCAAPTSAATTGMYGKMPGVAFEDYPKAKIIIIWGANPKASNIHLVPFLKEAKANGTKIVIIDPRINFSAREYDLHLPVYPGTDLVVALAMIRYWHEQRKLNHTFLDEHSVNLEILLEKASHYSFQKAADISRVSAADIEKLAIWYEENNPAVIRIGWGLERNQNGGNAAAAILALPALLGKFGVSGGGYTLSNSNATRIDRQKFAPPPPWNTRELNMNLLGQLLLEEKNPPIKALFVYNANPAVTVPNQTAILNGLSRQDLFTVVFDQVMTDTAKFADLLLPAVTFLEQEELKNSYGSYVFQYGAPVIPACGEAKPNEQVFARLGRAMGWDDPVFQKETEDYLREAATALPGLGKAVTLETMRSKRVIAFDFPGPTPVQFGNVFPRTADGKINLAPSTLGANLYEYREVQIDDRFPLALISPATNKTISSMLGEFNLPELYVLMNPEDAQLRELEDAATVKVFNEHGEVHCRLRIKSDVRKGVVLIPKGAWRKASRNGLTATALAPDTLGTAGGACFNDARVQVESHNEPPAK